MKKDAESFSNGKLQVTKDTVEMMVVTQSDNVNDVIYI